MKTYQFTLPHKADLTENLFLDRLSLEFKGNIVGAHLGRWTPPDALDTVEQEPIVVVQVSTDEGGILKERVFAYLRNIGERAVYFGHIGEHQIMNLNAGGGE